MSDENTSGSSCKHNPSRLSTDCILSWIQKVFRVLKNNGGWGFILGLVINAFKFTGIISMWLAHILMLLALFVAVGMIGGAENALRPESRRHTIVRLSTVIVLFVAIEGLMIWMANSTEKRGSGFLQFDRIDILQEYSWIVPGKRWGGNVYGLNPSSERIQNVVGSSWGFVEKVDDQADHRIKILADKQIMPLHKLYLTGKIKGKPEVGAGKELWGSVFTPPLTQDDADGINNGTVTIYFVSWWGWTDLQGHKDLGYDCRSLQVPLPTPYSKKDIIWHYCSQE